MNKTIRIALALGALSLLVTGCQKEADDVDKEKPPVAFEGSPDAKYAGTWKTEDGVSTYILDGAGTYKLSSKIQIKGQEPMTSHLTGQWAINGDKMLFKDQSANVAAYAFEFQGNKLTLTSTGSLKAKTIMDRQP